MVVSTLSKKRYSPHSYRSAIGEIVQRKISELTPDPNNPRVHSKTQLKRLARSLKEFGFVAPVIIDSEGRILVGHGRVGAAARLGWETVPTLCIDYLTPAQAKAYQIADNRLAELATWDRQQLGVILKDLSLELNFDVELTGFDMGEIDLIIGEADQVPEVAEDEVIPDSDGPAVTQLGDAWQLGRHRILCGNATDESAFKVLMCGKVVKLVFVDPPYNVKVAHIGSRGRYKHREFVMASGEMTEEQYVEFLSKAFLLLARYSADGSIHFVCIDWRHVKDLLTAGERAYSELLNLCIWVKHNAGMGSLYRSQHEMVAVFKNGKKAHRNNVLLGKYGRNRTNVWNYPGANSLAASGEEGNPLALHSTPKPVALVMDAILDCSARGDVVLDTFLGSGTTLIAAERAGRTCYGMELDPLYVDTVVRRWQTYTGDEAHHVVTGKPFGAGRARQPKGARHG